MPPARKVRDFAAIRSVEEARALADKLLADGRRCGFDIETGYHGEDRVHGALDPNWAEQFIVGFSITNDPGWARYLPLRHDDPTGNLPPQEVWEIFRPVLEGLEIVAHHKKFEDKNLARLDRKGDALSPIRTRRGYCSMLSAYVLSKWEGAMTGEGQMSATGLKTLTKMVLKEEQAELWDLFPKKPDGSSALTQKQKDSVRFNVLPLTPAVIAYACDDAALALELEELIGPMAAQERGLMWTIERTVSEIMVDVENYGVAVDWAGMAVARAQYPKFRANMEKAVKAGFSAMAGRDVSLMNLGSTVQLKKLLYDELGLRTTRLTKTGQPSTDEIALESLSRQYPAIRKLLDLRQTDNMGKRLDKWLDEFRYAEDDRVHPNFAQTVVGTGRFAANDPPIQQCPKEWRWVTKLGVDAWSEEAWRTVLDEGTNGVDYWTGNFRDFIIAAPGYYQLTFDYSQIELRVLAGVSGERMLLDAFENDQDVHTLTAAMMLGKRPEDVNPKTERPIGKTMNFALLYQMGVKSLAERLGIPMDKAERLYAEYFRQFSSVTTWMEKAKRDGLRHRYAETPFGRRYTVWELYSDNRRVYAKGERVLINAPIQGGAADYMKLAMIRVRKALQDEGLWGNGVMITMNQHDALTFDVRNDIDPNWLRPILERAVVFDPRAMIKGFSYDFPKIVADWEIGQRWGSATAWRKGMVARWDGETWTLGEGGETTSSEAQTHLSTTSGHVPGSRPASAPPSTESSPPSAGSREATTTSASPTPTSEERSGPADDAASQATELIVEIRDMPDEAQLRGLVTLLEGAPGARPVTLRTPEGDVLLPLRTRLGIGDRAKISLSVGGATVYEPTTSETLDALAAKLSI